MGTGEKGRVPECFAIWWRFLKVEVLVQRQQDALVRAGVFLGKKLATKPLCCTWSYYAQQPSNSSRGQKRWTIRCYQKSK